MTKRRKGTDCAGRTRQTRRREADSTLFGGPMLGFVLAFAPRDSFELKSGGDELTEYLFNKKEVRHLFCRTCGVESFAYGEMPDRSPVATINLNCLEGVDPRALTPMHVDGRQY